MEALHPEAMHSNRLYSAVGPVLYPSDPNEPPRLYEFSPAGLERLRV